MLAGMADQEIGVKPSGLLPDPDAAITKGRSQNPLRIVGRSLSMGRAVPTQRLSKDEFEISGRRDPGERTLSRSPFKHVPSGGFTSAAALSRHSAGSIVPDSAGAFGPHSMQSTQGSTRGFRCSRLEYIAVRDPPTEPIPGSLSGGPCLDSQSGDGMPQRPGCSGMDAPRASTEGSAAFERSDDSAGGAASGARGAQCSGGSIPGSARHPDAVARPTENEADGSAAALRGSSTQPMGVRDAGEPVRDEGRAVGSLVRGSAAGSVTVRYSKAQLKATLQLMGCKSRHAHKVSD